jgi:hypothetical protein
MTMKMRACHLLKNKLVYGCRVLKKTSKRSKLHPPPLRTLYEIMTVMQTKSVMALNEITDIKKMQKIL